MGNEINGNSKHNLLIFYEQLDLPAKVRLNPNIYSPILEYRELKLFNGIPIPHIDKWVPDPKVNKIFFSTAAGYIIAPVRLSFKYTGDDNEKLDLFYTSSKKCYNSPFMRNHTTNYINYFENYFDTDHEYMAVLFQLKAMVDGVVNGAVGRDPSQKINMPEDMFIDNVARYILNPSILQKVRNLVDHNYDLNLDYRNINNPSLQYTNVHAKRLMEASFLINLCIPILTHYAQEYQLTNINEFLLKAFDKVFNLFTDVDIYNKLYETSNTNIIKSEKSNAPIWAKQSIRGKNVTTHSLSSVENIIFNIMPKYDFSQNVVSMNYSSILNNTGFQVLDIEYEFSFIPLSSSKIDEDNMSDFD